MKQNCKMPQKDTKLFYTFENYTIVSNILSTISYIAIRERKMQQHWLIFFEKRIIIYLLSLIKMKGGLNMSLIQNAVYRANNTGLGHFMHQDPFSNERCTSRNRRTSRNQRRTSNIRRTSRNQRCTSRVRQTSRNQRRTSRVRRTSRNQRRTSSRRRTSRNKRCTRRNSFWNDLLF